MALFKKREQDISPAIETIGISFSGMTKDNGKITPSDQNVNQIQGLTPIQNLIKEAIDDTQFKGEVQQNKVRFPKDLGEEHPYNPKITEDICTLVGYVNGMISKFVDFVWGAGITLKTENEAAKEILEQWMIDNDFNVNGRSWFKEALVKPAGILELGGEDETKPPKGIKVLNFNYMYLVRDKKGKEIGWNQYKGAWDKFIKGGDDVIPFKPFQIAPIMFNKSGDNPYGLGIIYPSLRTINDLLGNRKYRALLLKRKAGAPIIATIGRPEVNPKMMPKAGAVDAFAAKLEHFTNKTEIAVDALVDLKVLDFGNLAERFDSAILDDLDDLHGAMQIPQVLMGKGNIAEGLADTQLDGLERTAKSYQEEIEKTIENRIFKRVLMGNGIQEHVEVEWGQPSAKEKTERITKVTELLKMFNLSEVLRVRLELELSKLLGFEKSLDEEIESEGEERKADKDEMKALQKKMMANPQAPGGTSPSEKKPVVPGRKKEETKVKQPRVPGANRPNAKLYDKECVCAHCESLTQDYTLKEWLGFDYMLFTKIITGLIKEDDFEFLKAMTSEELTAGKFTDIQIEELRNILKEGFQEHKTINQMAEEISSRVKPSDLYATENGKLKLNKTGDKILRLSSPERGINIARTETTRFGAEGSIQHYTEAGVTQLQFVASYGMRTCPECNDLNGIIFTKTEAQGIIPVHSMCRCTWLPVV